MLQTLTQREVRQVVCGGTHSLALLCSGALWSWDANSAPRRLDFEEEVLCCSAGQTHSAAIARLKGIPTLYFWGRMQGDEGSEDSFHSPTVLQGPKQLTPIKVTSGTQHLLIIYRSVNQQKHLSIYARPSSGMTGRKLSAQAVKDNQARLFSLACKDVVDAWTCGRQCFYQYERMRKKTAESGLVAWGDNSSGQLGLCHYRLTSTFEDVVFFNDTKVRSVSGGESHTIVLTERRLIFAFGSNSDGQLGLPDVDRSSTPLLVELPEDICRVSACGFLNYAVASTGQLYSWGSAPYTTRSSRPTIISPSLFNNEPIITVAAGLSHSLFLTADHDANTPRITKRRLEVKGLCPKRRKN